MKKPETELGFDPIVSVPMWRREIKMTRWHKIPNRPFCTRSYKTHNMQAVTVLHFMLSDSPHSYTHHRDEAWIGINQWRRVDTIKDDFNKQIMGTPVGCDQLILRKAQLEAEIEQLENAINANVDVPFLLEKYNQNNKWLNLVNDLIENKKCQK